MTKEYRDQTGNVWERYDNSYAQGPSYEVPHGKITEIERHILSLVDGHYVSYCFRLLPIPIFSVPMWVKHEKNIYTPLHYSYSVCCECQRVCRGPVQLCVLLLLCRYEDGTFSYAKRALVRCIECNPRMLLECSYYGFILGAQRAITKPLDYGWSTFEPPYLREQHACYMCESEGCRSIQCQLEYEFICRTSGDPRRIPHIRACMDDLQWHFFSIELNIVSKFLANMCYNPMCRQRLTQRVDAHMCDNCRRVVYCSEKCFATHHNAGECTWYLDCWL